MSHDVASDYEKKKYRKIEGEIVWLGSGALPQAAYVGYSMKQKLLRITIKDFEHGN